MGFFDSLFTNETQAPADPPNPDTMEFPRDEYDPAYPVAVRRSELEAFQTLIDEEQNTEFSEPEFFREAFDEIHAELSPSGQSYTDSLEEIRSDAEDLIEYWQDEVSNELSAVVVPIGARFRLQRQLTICESRHNDEDDPYELNQDSVATALPFLQRLSECESSEQAVITHVDSLPEIPSPSTPRFDNFDS